MNKAPINKKITNLVRDTGMTMKRNDIEVVVIFGMNIDNDQHIIRDIMFSLSDTSADKIKIVYCYFCNEDKKIFAEQYKAAITFRQDVSQRVKNIEVMYIRTQEILEEYFNKK